MVKTARTVLGIFLLILGVIGSLLPVIQGWIFFAAAIAVLGTDHAIVRWGRAKLEPLRARWDAFRKRHWPSSGDNAARPE
jgi:hypothetical protein